MVMSNPGEPSEGPEPTGDSDFGDSDLGDTDFDDNDLAGSDFSDTDFGDADLGGSDSFAGAGAFGGADPFAAMGGGGIGALFEQAQQMQAAMVAAQAELADARVEGSAGGGLVTATVNGGGELVALTISPAAVDPDDTETLADLVLAAVRDATTNAHRLAEQKMAAATGGFGGMLGGLGGGIPGLPGLG
jgi:nucleoid-associated protein EbfC